MQKLFLVSLMTMHSIVLSSIPGKIVGLDIVTGIPLVALNSLEIENWKILKEFKSETPEFPEWQLHGNYYENRNRIVYAASDKFVVKIWQKNYPSTPRFLAALNAGFYEGIAQIAALIRDDEGECRGYVSTRLIDRTFCRNVWESQGFVLEKGQLSKIFSRYAIQPIAFQKLFDALIDRTKKTGFIILDFCPDNVAFGLDREAYLIDLEDVQDLAVMHDSFSALIFFKYNPVDYIDALHAMAVRN